MHRAYLCLGSNIQPEENMRRAIDLLRINYGLVAVSNCYEVQAVGSDGAVHSEMPNFLNLAACIATPLDAPAVKAEIITPIERALGRMRTQDKFAPRTIDLDLTIFDQQVLDTNLWRRLYIALPFSELLPELVHPETGETLRQVAERLQTKDIAIQRVL